MPVDEFGRVFNLPEILCVGNDSSVYQENNNKYAIKFDPYLFDIPFGTMIHGYLQSYKYFHPHAETQIRKAFDFPGELSPLIAQFVVSCPPPSLSIKFILFSIVDVICTLVIGPYS